MDVAYDGEQAAISRGHARKEFERSLNLSAHNLALLVTAASGMIVPNSALREKYHIALTLFEYPLYPLK